MKTIDHGQVAVDGKLLWNLWFIVAVRIASVQNAVSPVDDKLL